MPTNKDLWVESVLAALAELYATAHRLPEVGLKDASKDIPESLAVSTEEWRSLFATVQSILGQQDLYWAYFDPSEPQDSKEEPICGSLADDLADIYADVKPGVRAWESGQDPYLENIVFAWKTPLFGSHWGVHAVSAMRALHPIAYMRGIQKG
jgi:hypothetical protein